MIKKLKRSNDLFIDFTEDELSKLSIEEGDKFSYELVNGDIVLKKHVPLEINLSEFSRETLEMLISHSIKNDCSVEDSIACILSDYIKDCNLNDKQS
jgi:hypothetical protein